MADPDPSPTQHSNSVVKFPVKQITQRDIVEIQVLEIQIKLKRRDLRDLIAVRASKKKLLADRLIGGAEVEDGLHTAIVKTITKLLLL